MGADFIRHRSPEKIVIDNERGKSEWSELKVYANTNANDNTNDDINILMKQQDDFNKLWEDFEKLANDFLSKPIDLGIDLEMTKGLSMEDKRKKLLGNLNDLPELSLVLSEDIESFIRLYEQRNKDKKDIYATIKIDKLEVQTCLYEVIKDSEKYEQVIDKLAPLYEKQLDSRLRKDIYDDGAIMDHYQLPYSEQPEYSMILADMYANQMKRHSNQKDIKTLESYLKSYEKIKSDMNNANITMNISNEEIVENTKKHIQSIKLQQQLQQQEEINRVNEIKNKRIQLQQQIQLMKDNINNLLWSNASLGVKLRTEHGNEYQRYGDILKDIKYHEEQMEKNPYLTLDQISSDINYYENVQKQMGTFHTMCEQVVQEIKNQQEQEKIQKEQQERLKQERIQREQQEKLEQERIQREHQQNTNQSKQDEEIRNDTNNNKNHLVGQIMGEMINAGEFNISDNDSLSMEDKFNAMDNMRRKLQEKSEEELNWVLSMYAKQQENENEGVKRI